MWVKAGLVLSLLLSVLSASAGSIFLARILLWTFEGWPEPIAPLIRMVVWYALSASLFWLYRYLFRIYQSQEKGTA